MNRLRLLIFLPSFAAYGFVTPADFPFAPAAGKPGSTAVAMADPALVAWAEEVVRIRYGEGVDESFRTPERALGPARGGSHDVVSLGRGGEIVVGFPGLIQDGPGPDFVVFENGFSDDFLELAWVEVSSDGETFVRFPNYSATAGPVGAFGGVDPAKLHGFAGKYRAGFGTPFDLEDLAGAHAAAVAGTDPFSDAYREHLLETFPLLDIGKIRYIRLVDIPGDGSAESAAGDFSGKGFPIYDPFPTLGSAGFDLDAVGVFHPGEAGSREDYVAYARRLGLPPTPAEDSDGDGDPNGLEFLTGTDPLDAASRRAYAVELVEPGGVVQLRLRRGPAREADFRIRSSANLIDWETSPHEILETLPEEDEEGSGCLMLTFPGGLAGPFLRIEVVLDPGS
ncbi:MAG TPA: hypothetical protein VJ960_08645 [Oceanipulchritudo sp.]|nr:hypothetical protein [Oceanipulchritudo sp.]